MSSTIMYGSNRLAGRQCPVCVALYCVQLSAPPGMWHVIQRWIAHVTGILNKDIETCYLWLSLIIWLHGEVWVLHPAGTPTCHSITGMYMRDLRTLLDTATSMRCHAVISRERAQGRRLTSQIAVRVKQVVLQMGLASTSRVCATTVAWLAQCQDNVNEWDSRPWCWRAGFPVVEHY